MEHREAAERLGEYADGELPRGERPGLEAHLAACRACRSELEAWRAASRALFSRPAPPRAEETEAFARRVLAALPREAAPAEARPRAWPGPGLWPRAALAAGAAAAAALFFAWGPGPGAPDAEDEAYVSELIDGDGLGDAALEPELEDFFL